MFILADDIVRIRERVKRLMSPDCHAEYPHSRTRRLIGNVRIVSDDGQQITVAANFVCHRYRRYDFTCTGESACADSWGRALATRQTSLSLPCYAERRYGGVADDELLMACPPDEFLRAIEGMGHLGKNGLRYPFPPYGAAMDPSFGMAKSYG